MTLPASAFKGLWVMCGVFLLVSFWEEPGNMKNTHCDFLEMWSGVLKDSMVSVKETSF